MGSWARFLCFLDSWARFLGFLGSWVLGILLIAVFYNFSSKFKFLYLDLKNSYSNDNKYLAVVNENGLWITDEIDNKIYIINAIKIKNNFLKEVSISQFDDKFELIKVIRSSEVNILNKEWLIFNPKITFMDNKTIDSNENL